MYNVLKVVSGVGLLIFTFLLLNNGKATADIISSIGTNSVSTIKVLQGR